MSVRGPHLAQTRARDALMRPCDHPPHSPLWNPWLRNCTVLCKV